MSSLCWISRRPLISLGFLRFSCCFSSRLAVAWGATHRLDPPAAQLIGSSSSLSLCSSQTSEQGECSPCFFDRRSSRFTPTSYSTSVTERSLRPSKTPSGSNCSLSAASSCSSTAPPSNGETRAEAARVPSIQLSPAPDLQHRQLPLTNNGQHCRVKQESEG